MQEKLDRLRQLVISAIYSENPLYRSVHDLSVKADVDTPTLAKFLKAQAGESGKTSFVFAAKLLYAIGGCVLFPDEREGDVPDPIVQPRARPPQVDQADPQKVYGYEVATRELQSLVLKLFREANERAESKKTGGEQDESSD